ncbi:hypothetical protein [Sphingobacterium hungaricum]|uniref:DUF5034 domain-containing protein n=1 Tax=Sphingobacterium hungaricum TaxID=2082723 RepID=A0A928V1N9_9SPHI|nr:hypothetical protein [Sphingobacterium hungaricum]MBE8715341.1 hypothetical protein [Sphingobacterium hungaricum]
MGVNIAFRRFILLASFVALSVCTAMQCKKDDYIYYDLEGLEGKKIEIGLTPASSSYKVGELITIEGKITPQDIGLSDFQKLEEPTLASFYFYDQNNIPNIDYEAFKLVSSETRFNDDRTTYSIKITYEIKNKGLYKVMNDPSFSSHNLYSVVYVTVLSGQRKPRGYRGYLPLVFTNNNKTFMEIEVIE